MKTMIAACAFGMIAAATVPAFAQTTKAPVYRYCLQESGGRDGGSSTLCRFNTLAQCWMSKTRPSDFCYPNPELTTRR